jgi:hypothetical protein
LESKEMKVLKLEFDMFNGVHWEMRDYKITTLNMKQMEEAVKTILEWESPRYQKLDPIEKRWNKLKSFVFTEELEFPIVEEIES